MVYNPVIKTPPTDEEPRLFLYNVAASSFTCNAQHTLT